MVTLEKMVHLAFGSSFDSLGQNTASLPDPHLVDLNPDRLTALGAGTRYDICTSSGCSFLEDQRLEGYNPGQVVCLRIPENFLYYLSMHERCSEPLLYEADSLTSEDNNQ